MPKRKIVNDLDAFDRMSAAQFTAPPPKPKRKKLNPRQRKRLRQLLKVVPDQWYKRYMNHLRSQKWRLFKVNILAERGTMCERCGKFGKQLELHHINYARMGHELPEDVKLYCRDCHTDMHRHRSWKGRGKKLIMEKHMAEQTPKSPENPLKAEVCECTRPGPFTRDNVCTKCEKPYLKSPGNSGEAKEHLHEWKNLEPGKWRCTICQAEGTGPVKYAKCLTCGYPAALHLGGPDDHGFPYVPVTNDDVTLWRKAGDSEQAIMSRIAARGMAAE